MGEKPETVKQKNREEIVSEICDIPVRTIQWFRAKRMKHDNEKVYSFTCKYRIYSIYRLPHTLFIVSYFLFSLIYTLKVMFVGKS